MHESLAARVPTRFRLRRSLIVIALIIAFVGSIGVGFKRLCARPIDVSGTVHVPALLKEVKEQDAIAYPVHRTLGAVLAEAGCGPTAVGLQ